jgi:hypothetical protein
VDEYLKVAEEKRNSSGLAGTNARVISPLSVTRLAEAGWS